MKKSGRLYLFLCIVCVIGVVIYLLLQNKHAQRANTSDIEYPCPEGFFRDRYTGANDAPVYGECIKDTTENRDKVSSQLGGA